MDENEAKTIIFLLWNDKLARTSVLFIIVVCLSLTIFLSFLSGFIVLAAYVGGFIIFSSVFKYRSEAPNFLSIVTGKQCGSTAVTHLKAWCAVCGSEKCNRHRPSASSHTRHPWIGLEVPEEIDEAIEDFLNKTLNEFVYSWYNELSKDESFVQELRQSIRYAASVLLRKILQVDLAHVIINKLVPAGLSHLDDYLGAIRLSTRQQIPLEKAAFQYLGPRLHPAARNRENELAYLRHFTALLLPHLQPPTHLRCKNFSVLIRELLSGWILLPILDVIADPAIINSLLLLLLERNTLTQYPDNSPTRVEFLARFVSSVPATYNSIKSSLPAYVASHLSSSAQYVSLMHQHFQALRLDLSSILKDQSLLYPFMQFLKREGFVNILQFCLDVEEFNRKMLTPELTKPDLENLYKEAWDLFSVYFSPESPDRIYFSPQVVSEMHAVLKEPAENIVKLRTTPPLFQAYEYAYSILENSLCPLFHESDDYYTLLCGQRLSSGYSKSGSRSTKKWSEGGAVARLSNRLHKIKGALRAQPVEGHTYDSDITLDLGESEFAEELQLTDTSETYRDLSAWRVSIPSVEIRHDVNNKPYPVFTIDVQRIDVRLEVTDDPDSYHWVVDRRYGDFYTLESKLTEFHGEFADTQLPPKRILFGPRGVEFMESKRLVFEDFLQRLLQKPTLRGSDLLHSFLRSTGEFLPAGGGGIAAVPEGLGRIIRRSVPLRLRKERGQHLDSFLSSFVASTEGSKSKSSKYEWKDISAEKPRKVRCLTKTVFQNNFGVESNQPLFALATSRPSSSCLPVQGMFDCLLYLAVRVFGAPQTVIKMVMTIRVVAHNTINALCSFYLDRKLRKLLVAPRVAHLVRLLQGAVFSPKSSPPSPAELELRAARALSQLQTLLPSYLARWAGPAYQAGLLTLFSALQSPPLNKQLAYTLLDVVATELYPDLATGEISPA